VTPDRWLRVEYLFHAALDQPIENRNAFLRNACEGDEELRREVLRLLAAETARVAFLESPALPIRSLQPGSRIGPYLIETLLGAGGMGEVFRAVDTRLHRTVAIKVLPPEKFSDPEHQRRFLQEARAVSALNHPNIVVLYDISSHAGMDFLVMEYVRGKTLKDLLLPAGLPFTEAVQFGAQTARALAKAHEAGVVHRDIKPANIMITPESQIKVLDFGVARRMEKPEIALGPETRTLTPSTTPGLILGTIGFMSPEQTRGELLDGRSDIFSLGSVLYLATTGRAPFSGASALSVLHEIATVHPPAPSTLRADLPTAFDFILDRAMAKAPEDRYSSATEFAEALEALLATARFVPARSIESAPPPVVGRDVEMRALKQSLANSLEGSGNFVLITGEPGIGKSALARSFLHAALMENPNLLVTRGACIEQYGTGEAYLPFLQSMPGLLAVAGRERILTLFRRYAPTWCLQFPSLFSGNTLDQLQRDAIGATKERMLREFGDAMDEIARVFPIVLLLEDLHWADASSIDLIRHLGQRIKTQRFMLLGTARLEEHERGYQQLKNCKRELLAQSACQEVTLETLGKEHIARYLNSQFSPNNFPPELAEIIFKKTEGHPLFATGVFQLLAQRGDVSKEDGTWRLVRPVSEMELAVPESVRSMILKKLEVLEEQDRRVIQFASIQGEEFLSNVLAGSLECDELALEERLSRLERYHHLIQMKAEEEVPDGTVTTRYRFAHALYQEFLYTDLLTKRRALLHRQAAEALLQFYQGQTARIAMQLATHFERGRDFPRAVEYLTQAGDDASGLLAHGQACEHFSRALDLSEKLPDGNRATIQMTLYKKRGDANLSRGLPQNAERDYNSLLTSAREAGDAECECRALIDLANVHVYTRKPEEMAACAGQALEIAERIEHRFYSCEAKGQLAASCQVIGRIEEAHRLYEDCIPAARNLRHTPALLQSLMYRGVAHFFRSEYDQAVAAETEVMELASRSRNGLYLALSRTYLGYSLANQGRISEALDCLNEALALGRRNENRIVLARAQNGIGWIYREIGLLRRAIEYDEACVETARAAGATEAEANALINLVYDYTMSGERTQGADAMQRVDALYDRELWNRWRFYEVRQQAASAEYWFAAGNLDRAEEHARALLANAQGYGVPKYVSTAHRILGAIAAVSGDVNKAEEQLMSSLMPLERNPAPLVEWRTHAALGRLMQQAGRRPIAAREAFRRAAEVIERLAGNITYSELRSAFIDTSDVRQVLSGCA